MNLILYYAPYACSLVPLITLREAGADFELRPTNLLKGEQLEPEFLKYNPKHKVPVLVVDGKPLTENVAIQTWIAKNFPEAKLLPDDFMDYCQALSLMTWCASGIHPTLTPNVKPERYCDLPDTADNVRQCAPKLMLENFAVAEDLLKGREYFFDHFTAVDAYFFWCFRRAHDFKVDVSHFQNCGEHFERMKKRESVKAAFEIEKEVLEKFSNS